MDASIHVPEVDAMHGLAVRPDVLVIPISAVVEAIAPTEAVSLLRAAAGKLQSRALGFHPRAELFARKIDFGRNTREKASKVSHTDAQIDGLLYVPLEENSDYWARAELVAKITESLRKFAVELYKAPNSIHSVHFGFRAPVPRVRDVTEYKRELTARYAAQWRALTGPGEKTPGLGAWEIPDEVAQVAVSLEEVRLMLVAARKVPPGRDV